MSITLSNTKKTLSNKTKVVRTRTSNFINRRPLASFFVLLGILLLLIILSNFLRRPPETTESNESVPTVVRTYSSSTSPRMTFSATIAKSGVINIYAQSPGVVQTVRVTEGDKVYRGQTLVNLSTNYQGGNVASISRQIAEKSHQANVENFDAQKDIIAKQKDLATKSNLQAEELREINRESLDDTRDLISLNKDIIDRINDQIEILESNPSTPQNDAAILGALQGRAAAEAGLAQLEAGLETAEYQTDDEETGAELSELNRDVTIKQLELQEKSLVLAKKISYLNLKLAQISESLMYPASPVAGTVERIYVSVGESVNPGALIATIKANQGENTAVVSVTRDIAKQISVTEASTLMVGSQEISLFPRYISTEATEGNLYAVIYDIPSEFATNLTDDELVQIQIPLGSSITVLNSTMVPLDAVYQTQNQSYVTIVNHTEEGEFRAQTIPVTLGQISGSFVEVTSGIDAEDQIITSRNVQDGDLVSIQE